MSLFRRPKKTISIDFSSSEIKIIEGKFSKKGVNISNSFSIPIPSEIYVDGKIEDMDQMVYLLKAGLNENKATANYVNGVINSTTIINREIVIPKMERSQIDSMIDYQIEDYLPINKDDYIVQYIILETLFDDGIEKLSIMLIGVPKYIVESHLNLIKNLGLRPNVLEYQGNAMGKLLGFNDLINDDLQIMDNTIASIDLGYEHTKLTIVKDGVIKVARIRYYFMSLSYIYLIILLDETRGQVNCLQSSGNSLIAAFSSISGYTYYKKKMVDSGLNIYEYQGPGSIHAKTAIFDREISMIGTFNVDPRSSYLSTESMLITNSKDFSEYLIK